MKRRTFLQTTTALAFTATTLPRTLAALPTDHPYMQSLGLQLYTLRNAMMEDPADTIKKVAAAGYKQVELMEAVGGQSIAEVAKDVGLQVSSAFFDWRTIVTPNAEGVPGIDQVIAAASDIGLKYLVFGYVGKGHRETIEHYQRIADATNQAAEKIQQAGMRLCYHNHSFEFEPLTPEVMGFEVLHERFDKQLVSFELDVFWVAIGGWSPVEILKKLGKQVSQLHLKDIKPGTGTIYDEGRVPETAFQEVGDGSIDFRELLRIAGELGVDQCHVEQDQSSAPLESIVQSIQYLRDMDL
jgi:sugar phosphate isomerase/epimerase